MEKLLSEIESKVKELYKQAKTHHQKRICLEFKTDIDAFRLENSRFALTEFSMN